MKKRIVLGEGYFDIGDCRRVVMLWEKPLERSCKQLKVNPANLIGLKVRLVAEVLDGRKRGKRD